MKEIDVVIVIPVGPGCRLDFLKDTLDSIAIYTHATYQIIIADDSHLGTGRFLKESYPNIDLMETPEPMGKLCGLYITLSLAFQKALAKYQFKLLLRMDSDALIIGDAPEKDALKLFTSHSEIGVAGQYPFEYSGKPWDISWPAGQLYRIMHTWRFFRRPLAHFVLRRYYRRAVRNGYRRGESVFGGACYYSYHCIRTLADNGLLPVKLMRYVHLEEDHLFAILIKSAGLTFGNLAGEGLPFACSWKGLPDSPSALIGKRKKIIHSTRFFENSTEQEIRQWFRSKRPSINVEDKIPQFIPD